MSSSSEDIEKEPTRPTSIIMLPSHLTKTSLENPTIRLTLEQKLKRNPEVMHYMLEQNITACMRGGDKTFVEIWGQYHFVDKSLVGCQYCLEWLHA